MSLIFDDQELLLTLAGLPGHDLLAAALHGPGVSRGQVFRGLALAGYAFSGVLVVVADDDARHEATTNDRAARDGVECHERMPCYRYESDSGE